MVLNLKMLKLVRVTPTFIIPILGERHENDYNLLNKQVDLEKPESGMARVKKMFTKNEYDEVSLELHSVVQSSLCGAFFGAVMGGFIKSQAAYINFIENNQATSFKTTMDAKKRLQDYVTVEFAKGAYKWGWKLGMFTGLFSLVSTTIQVYRGDVSLIDYVSAGAFVGASYKANLGLAATLVGAGVGATLSFIGGSLILGILKVSGVTMHDIRVSMHKIKEAKADQYNQAIEKAATIKNDELTRHHDQLVANRGKTNVNDLE